jgi:uncharacterized protein (DUF3084 family)
MSRRRRPPIGHFDFGALAILVTIGLALGGVLWNLTDRLSALEGKVDILREDVMRQVSVQTTTVTTTVASTTTTAVFLVQSYSSL